MDHVYGIKIFLRIPGHILDRGQLQFGITGTKTIGLFSPHHICSKAQCYDCKSIFRFNVRKRIEVIGLGDSTDVGIIFSVVFVSYYLLEDYRHFFFFDHTVDRVKVSSRTIGEYRWIHQFYGSFEIVDPAFDIGVVIGNQIRRINTCKRLTERIFEQTGRAYGQGFTHHFQVGAELVPEFLR